MNLMFEWYVVGAAAAVLYIIVSCTGNYASLTALKQLSFSFHSRFSFCNWIYSQKNQNNNFMCEK